VVLDLHREALVGGIERRPLGHGPGLENAVMLEAEVVVQPPGSVLLDDEAWVRGLGDALFPARLARLAEISLGPILGQFRLRHERRRL